MTNLDDTQPNAPVRPQKPLLNENPPEEEISSGPGCFVWFLIGVVAFGFSLLIVILGGTAGWTAGERITNNNGTATQQTAIAEQLIRIPTDAADGNTYNLAVRLNYLETVAPNIPAIPELRQTATQVYFNAQPTPTATPTPTDLPSPTPEPTLTPEIVDSPENTPETSAGSSTVDFDLPGLLQEARDQVALGQYVDAYETLDAIIRIDENFQRNAVRGLMLESLTTLANRNYTSTETLAEAIRWTDLAEEYGPIGDLPYERLLAVLYLDAQKFIGAGDHGSAINRLSQMISFQTSYKGIDLNRQLFNAYVNYGEAFEIYDRNHCQAVVQYTNALRLFNDQSLAGRRDAAQTICERGTPTPLPDGETAPEGEAPVAPIGVPGT